MNAQRQLYHTPPRHDQDQEAVIKYRRSGLGPAYAALFYALVFVLPLWLFEYQRAQRVKMALEVQRLTQDREALASALHEAEARLESLRRLETVERVAAGPLGLSRVAMERVLPAAAGPRPALPPPAAPAVKTANREDLRPAAVSSGGGDGH
jgi:hypothetical protein